jgi:hypothetical protein
MTGHKWTKVENYQWCENGDSYNSARSTYTCENCGQQFIHRYHTVPSIYVALKNAGLDGECDNNLKDGKTWTN